MTIHTSCGKCGVEFCMPQALYEARQRDGEGFYCPNGHARVFRETVDQRRIKELEGQLASRDRRLDRLRDDYTEILAQREELLGALKECPGRCGWKSRKQIPRDPVGMGRGLERVRLDVAEHLVRVHGAGRSIASEPRQLEAGS